MRIYTDKNVSSKRLRLASARTKPQRLGLEDQPSVASSVVDPNRGRLIETEIHLDCDRHRYRVPMECRRLEAILPYGLDSLLIQAHA